MLKFIKEKPRNQETGIKNYIKQKKQTKIQNAKEFENYKKTKSRKE